MIAFVSLFLGLVLGTQTVEVLVGETVVSVEIRLDGRELARRSENPRWQTA